MNFAYPHILYLLFLLPILTLLLIWARLSRRRKLERFGRFDTIKPLMPQASYAMVFIKTVLEMIAVGALVIALARPRGIGSEVTEQANGIEMIVALDISRSMDASSTDNARGVSRLDRAKLLINKIIDQLGDNRIGLVLFAGSAYTQLPITTDFISARVFLDEIRTSTAPNQGTNIASAIEKGMSSFSDYNDINKAIVIITDGEDHEPGAIEMARKASEAGIEVDVIGIGSMGKVPIPVGSGNNDFFRDYEGNIVTTALDETMAQDVAKAGNGVYINGSASDAISALSSQIDKIEKKTLGEVKYKASAERFPLFVWIAFIALFIDIFLLERKFTWIQKLNIFNIRN